MIREPAWDQEGQYADDAEEERAPSDDFGIVLPCVDCDKGQCERHGLGQSRKRKQRRYVCDRRHPGVCVDLDCHNG